ncbi:hypothetical protein BX661DRAFT_140313, partial [Kickxella alabastrina]|uniref:uncharacterized protein n=1 Tax=Kickxella alabastrina TaxID=61397 RepID=UPI00221F782E
VGKSVPCDTGRRDMLYCLGCKSNCKKCERNSFYHTKNSEANKHRERVFPQIRENAKKILSALNHPNPSTLDCKLYVEYLLECRKGDFILGEHYHNTQTLGKSRKYDGSSSNDPLHRKLRYLFFVNRKRADVELAKSGPDPVLIFSNWIPSMTCHRESIRGKGLQEMLIGVNTIPAVEKPRQILLHDLLQCVMEDCL